MATDARRRHGPADSPARGAGVRALRGLALRSLALGACLLGVPACTAARRIDRAAIDYNVSLAGAQNQVLLLNVARAAKKHPLLLSAVSQVSHSIETKAGLGVSIPFGFGSTDEYGASPSMEVSGGPTMDVVPLDTENFMRGFLAPVSQETFGQYLEGGWPPELLLKVFVREIVDSDGTHYLGRPATDMTEYAAYEGMVRRIKDRLRPEQQRERVGPAVAVSDQRPLSLRDLVAARKAGFGLEVTQGKVQLLGKSEWCVRIEPEPTAAAEGAGSDAEGREKGGPAEDEHGPRLVMRSPEGILYFLGQIVRLERKLGHPPVLVGGKPLFSADPRRARCGACSCGVAVEYCGETYAVSGDPDADESMHVLSLLAQVIGLQKSADELPRSAVVRLVGQ